MSKVEVRCPACEKRGIIEVEENIVVNSPRGVTAVNVAEYLICEHSFVAYIDRNFSVRDCFISDFTVELPQIKINMPEITTIDTIAEKIDIYLITLNVSIKSLSNILRGCFNKKKIIFVNDLEILTSHFLNFLDFAFQDTFMTDLIVMNSDMYKKTKKEYKNDIVLTNDKIIKDKAGFLKEKLVKIESAIIQKFLSEYDLEAGLIILRNEIFKAYKFCNELIKEAEKNGKPITQKLMVDYITESYNFKMTKSYMNFLATILKNYFGKEVKGISDVDTFIDFI
ncbi:MAG: hypothetical protein ACFFBP_00190 [Promethearchaeota archaeon]